MCQITGSSACRWFIIQAADLPQVNCIVLKSKTDYKPKSKPDLIRAFFLYFSGSRTICSLN